MSLEWRSEHRRIEERMREGRYGRRREEKGTREKIIKRVEDLRNEATGGAQKSREGKL